MDTQAIRKDARSTEGKSGNQETSEETSEPRDWLDSADWIAGCSGWLPGELAGLLACWLAGLLVGCRGRAAWLAWRRGLPTMAGLSVLAWLAGFAEMATVSLDWSGWVAAQAEASGLTDLTD